MPAEEVYSKGIDARNQALAKMGVTPGDLEKLSRVPLICAIVGLFINILLLAAMGNFAWLKATALSDGQPFTAFLSLTGAQFGSPSNPTADSKYFCGGSKTECGLGYLCNAAQDVSTFENGLFKSTPTEAWCSAARAGATALTLLWYARTPCRPEGRPQRAARPSLLTSSAAWHAQVWLHPEPGGDGLHLHVRW